MSASLYITKERLVCIQITATQHKNWILLLRWYLFDCRKDWEGVIGVRPPTALRKHQPERGGIQRPGRSCHLRGYHNYLWGWAQPQVTDSIGTTSTLSITTLGTYENQSIRSYGDPMPKYKHYT